MPSRFYHFLLPPFNTGLVTNVCCSVHLLTHLNIMCGLSSILLDFEREKKRRNNNQITILYSFNPTEQFIHMIMRSNVPSALHKLLSSHQRSKVGLVGDDPKKKVAKVDCDFHILTCKGWSTVKFLKSKDSAMSLISLAFNLRNMQSASDAQSACTADHLS